MSTVFYNLITVTGPRRAVDDFCTDARRRVTGKLAKDIGARQIAWSFEKLFELHPALADECEDPPRDEWHYLVSAGKIMRWGRSFQARFTLEVSNYQIHEMIEPLSRFYRALCFVNAELCLDDSTVMSAFGHCAYGLLSRAACESANRRHVHGRRGGQGGGATRLA